MTRDRLRPAALARQVLLPPMVGGVVVACLLIALVVSGETGAKAGNPLTAGAEPLVQQLSIDLEGIPTVVDIQRAKKPLSERKRLLGKHPYFELYKAAKRRFGVSWFLVASVHYQETGFGKAPAHLVKRPTWQRFRMASRGMTRPERYPHRSAGHPSVRDDFDVVMAIAAELKAAGATDLAGPAERAAAARYGANPGGRLSSAMVIERARAWKQLGTLPLPGRSELATPVKGIVGGCGYFGCPRPGHLHNGVDFLAPTGTPIHAADGGTVAVLESPGESGGYGNFVCLQHRPHLATCYAHLSAVAATVTAGAQIRRGDVIGLVGSTGSSSAPHLHFEVRRGAADCQSCAIDPLPMLDGAVPEAAVPSMVALPTLLSKPAGDHVASSATPLPATPPPLQRRLETGPPVAGREPGQDVAPKTTPPSPVTGPPAPQRPAPSSAPPPTDSAPTPQAPVSGGTAPVTPGQQPEPRQPAPQTPPAPDPTAEPEPATAPPAPSAPAPPTSPPGSGGTPAP